MPLGRGPKGRRHPSKSSPAGSMVAWRSRSCFLKCRDLSLMKKGLEFENSLLSEQKVCPRAPILWNTRRQGILAGSVSHSRRF
jgi:hypothetical protein